ncbi:iron ABC transporter substrate-binding protein [Pyrococcus sp. ST04]|uniref:iron ABC transporter substrate-binding protein n=1 Tax=Pyrococcus sp. ST04 TaxID=1183377 RepID=UPI0002605CE4|nr:iron ABC transporter substrate-binding protein [Pyrococcus sp. ST04]AFK22422.1 iron (III) ABC transporter [Pyrococcus sp. ST04]
MKRKVIVMAFPIILILFLSLGCVSTETQTQANTVKIKDMLGREVDVPTKVSRIVAAGPGCLRLIVYLNATNFVVGVEDFEKRFNFGRPYILAHPELRNLPTIGPGGPGKLPDLEEIMKLKPDVIFMTYVDAKTADDIQAKTGIPVVVLSYGKLGTFTDEELFKSLEIAGKILHKEKRAKEIIEFIKSVQKDLEERTKDVTPKTAYVGGIGYKGAHGIESTDASYPPFKAVNAYNVASALGEGHKFIDKEKLLEWQPEYIFIDEGGLSIVLEDYKKNPEFYNSLKAVREGKVYGLLPYNFYATNIGTAIADAYFIGKVLYPDKFRDIDPKEKANEIYQFLVGKPVYEELAKQFGGFGKINLENGSVKYSLPKNP